MNTNNKKFRFIMGIALLAVFMTFAGCQSNDAVTKENETMDTPISKIISVDISELCPGTPDLELAVEKGIIDDVEDEATYLELEHKYLSLLNTYLSQNTSLNEYQKCLDKSELDFPVEDKDIYFERGAFGRANIAIRNIAFIERLSEDDVKLLKELPNPELIEYTRDLDLFVSRTWKALITVVLEEGETEPYSIVYDVDAINKTSAMSNSLVFELIYNLEYEDGNMTEDTKDKYEKACEVAELMEKEMGNEIGHEVTVLIKVR